MSQAVVAPFIGGGLGYGFTELHYTVTYTECTAPGRPQFCDGSSIPRENSGFTLEVSAGVNVAFVSRIGGFAAVRVSSGYLDRPGTLGALAG
jgi:hypothetical protein